MAFDCLPATGIVEADGVIRFPPGTTCATGVPEYSFSIGGNEDVAQVVPGWARVGVNFGEDLSTFMNPPKAIPTGGSIGRSGLPERVDGPEDEVLRVCPKITSHPNPLIWSPIQLARGRWVEDIFP